MCVCVTEMRIEGGSVGGPSGGEAGIRASSESGEFVGDPSAVQHVHPSKWGKEGGD